MDTGQKTIMDAYPQQYVTWVTKYLKGCFFLYDYA